MPKPVSSPHLVPFDGSFKLRKAPTRPREDPGKDECRARLAAATERLYDLQRRLYADDRYSVLAVFQAMDAAGKDSTIRHVLTGVNPAGCQVYGFKRPSPEEYDHDFLWRTAKRLPERGRIGVFNRSYYESVLVVRVHPEFLDGEKLPKRLVTKRIWDERLESIREHERHLARNGTVVVKFWLNVSQAEQLNRFRDRLGDPAKNWKFSAGDLAERALWPKYMEAYEAALNGTSREWAPWYAIPADDKPYMRMVVAEVLADTLEGLGVDYPPLTAEQKAELEEARRDLGVTLEAADPDGAPADEEREAKDKKEKKKDKKDKKRGDKAKHKDKKRKGDKDKHKDKKRKGEETAGEETAGEEQPAGEERSAGEGDEAAAPPG